MPEINFAPADLISACELIYALSKAMEHDWFRFCSVIAPETIEAEAKKRAADPIAALLEELEQTRSGGLSS